MKNKNDNALEKPAVLGGSEAATVETALMPEAATKETAVAVELHPATSEQKPVTAPEHRPDNPAGAYFFRMALLVVILIVAFLVSACLGRYSISPAELLSVIGAAIQSWWEQVAALFTGGIASVSEETAEALSGQVPTLLLEVRLPRIIVCVFVGAALSVAGASYQGLFQNPMCSQDVLGASSGAAFGAALGILLGFGSIMISVSAFVCGLVAVALSYVVSKLSRGNAILALILAGMVVSSLFSSGTSAIKLVADTEEVLPAITYWLMGSLASIRSSQVLPTLALIVIATLPIFLLRWRINLLATGEEEAKSMGLNTGALRLIVIGCATFLTATCVSVSGLIGWVGLVIPHFCRLMLGNDYRRIIPASMLMGASFLLVVDDFARLLVTSEIPIGILTSFVGAPIFLFLLVKGGAIHRGTKR